MADIVVTTRAEKEKLVEHSLEYKVFYFYGDMASGKSIIFGRIKEKYEDKVNIIFGELPLYEEGVINKLRYTKEMRDRRCYNNDKDFVTFIHGHEYSDEVKRFYPDCFTACFIGSELPPKA